MYMSNIGYIVNDNFIVQTLSICLTFVHVTANISFMVSQLSVNGELIVAADPMLSPAIAMTAQNVIADTSTPLH